MTRCIDIFRANFLPLEKDVNKGIATDYIDFVNEELFYIENKYLPKVVVYEWIDGMIDYMPIYFNQEIVNKDHCLNCLINGNIMDYYPRVKHAFDIKCEYNYEVIYSTDSIKRDDRLKERQILIMEIAKNVKKYGKH